MRRKRPETDAPATDEVIDGLFVTCDAAADLSDMDAFHRKVASGERAEMLARIAKLDPESPTRH
ncbi:MAG TPA: hypothetical protein VEC95_08505 [Terriglobales bacterium]|nr:hypothetical protein [Terriglobales bacterium]